MTTKSLTQPQKALAEQSPAKRWDWFTQFRVIPPLETYPRLVSFTTTTPGKALLVIVFTLGYWIAVVPNPSAAGGMGSSVPPWWLLSAILLTLTWLPKWRWALIGLATSGWALFGRDSSADQVLTQLTNSGFAASIPQQVVHGLRIVAVFAFFAAYHTLARRSSILWVRRRAFWIFLALFVIGCMLASSVESGTTLANLSWAFLTVWGTYLWFFGYALENLKHKSPSGLTQQVGAFYPFWGSTQTPYPKGIGYLKKIEAQDSVQLAKTQLKAVKLIYWVVVLKVVKAVTKVAFCGMVFWKFNDTIPMSLANVPDISTVFEATLNGTDTALTTRWAALLLSSFLDILSLCIAGGKIIAVCRMAGFNALRNSCRPLQCGTLFDFWNRYYYYFKELLVDFFFFPTFFIFFKQHPRLRTFFATLVAAWLGNFLYHVMRDLHFVIRWGLWEAMANYGVNFFYCFVLAVSIGVSQFRKLTCKPIVNGWLPRRVLAPAFVFVYFSLLNTFDSPHRNTTLWEHVVFLLGFFGL